MKLYITGIRPAWWWVLFQREFLSTSRYCTLFTSHKCNINMDCGTK